MCISDRDYVLAEDINKLIDLAAIVDAGSCPEDSQFCDMYTRYEPASTISAKSIKDVYKRQIYTTL